MRKAGLGDASPGHPTLLALLEAKTTDAEFTHAAVTAVERGKGYVYALGMLSKQRNEASALTLHRGPLPNKQQAIEDNNRRVAADWLAQHGAA